MSVLITDRVLAQVLQATLKIAALSGN